MDLATLIQHLLRIQGQSDQPDMSSSDMYMEQPMIYSDSDAYPLQWYLYNKNPNLHDQLWPSANSPQMVGGPNNSTGSLGDTLNQKQEYENYRRDQLFQEIHRRQLIRQLKGLL